MARLVLEPVTAVFAECFFLLVYTVDVEKPINKGI